MTRSNDTRRPPDNSEGDVNGSSARKAWAETNTPGHAAIVNQDAEVFLHQALSSPCLAALRSASGCWLEDEQGRRYLDWHGNSVHQIGHAHPEVVAALKSQLDALAFCPRRFTNQPAVRLAQELVALTGGALGRVLLAPGGSAAMGIALKIARMATGRHKTLSFLGSFHGASLDCISIGGEAIFRRGVGPLLPGALLVPPPSPDRCILECAGRCGKKSVGGGMPCLNALQLAMESEGDIAAVIAEPIRCTTVSVPPAEYWPAVRALCDRHGALLIFDEIPTCLGRTGRMFAYEHFGVVPDVVVMGKGLGGGVVPQAAILCRDGLLDGSTSALGHYTHEKSPLGAAAALATIRVIREEKLLERSVSLGAALVARLRSLQASHPVIHQVRGLGLLLGVELRGVGTRSADVIAERVLYASLERGLSYKVSGGNVLTFTPPLVMTGDEMDMALDVLDESLAVGVL